MAEYYFTYGSDPKFPYQGGFTAVDADDLETAVRAFRHFHKCRPSSTGEFLSCSAVYASNEWQKTAMSRNPGCRCHEKIAANVCVSTMDESGDWIMEAIGYRREVLPEP